MYQFERNTRTRTITLIARGETPAELIEAALRGVLATARAGQPLAPSGDEVAVPVRGEGTDLSRLFAELARDLIGQIEEVGPGLDDLRLDGLLRTDGGGYTAWGYLRGTAGSGELATQSLTVGEPDLTEMDGDLRFVCELRLG